MAIHLEGRSLVNPQQLEVAVNGPDGATHLIFCTGIVNLGACDSDTYTFFVGPQISRRQFVGAIASGALSTIQVHGNSGSSDTALELEAHLLGLDTNYDDEASQVKVSIEISSNISAMKLAISYQVSILAELLLPR